MPSPLIPLESLQIASPCRADWHAMQGNDCVRFCPSCGKNVYNLSAMTRDEAERLIEKKEGNLCVRLKRRSDGTVINKDCPVGSSSRKRQRWAVQLLAGASAAVAALFGLRSVLVTRSSNEPETASTEVSLGIAGPALDNMAPHTLERDAPVLNTLGVDAPSSVTATPNAEPTQIVMGSTSAPTQ